MVQLKQFLKLNLKKILLFPLRFIKKNKNKNEYLLWKYSPSASINSCFSDVILLINFNL